MRKSPRSACAIEERKPGAADIEAELEANAERFRKQLGEWYRKHARVLPWRGINDSYATWLSEIMLQQTRVATVLDRYGEFLFRFPTVEHLAAADEADVLALWSGLGYYRRARMLHRAAQFVVRELGGKLPRTSVELRTLPGVGNYTAAAIASIAFGESVAVVDGNVERVLLRLLGLPEENSSESRNRIARTAKALIPQSAKRKGRGNPPGDHNQAMMELGATICLPKAPLCAQCPVSELCRTQGEHRTQPREKQNSRTVAHLLALRKAGTTTEVLLERRPSSASLMPGMLELPGLPLDAVQKREPVLRIRHAITNTNYYAQIFSEGAPATAQGVEEDEENLLGGAEALDEELFVAPQNDALRVGENIGSSLLAEISGLPEDLLWTPTRRLRHLPLTGLTRKALQRLGVMTVPTVKIG